MTLSTYTNCCAVAARMPKYTNITLKEQSTWTDQVNDLVESSGMSSTGNTKGLKYIMCMRHIMSKYAALTFAFV